MVHVLFLDLLVVHGADMIGREGAAYGTMWHMRRHVTCDDGFKATYAQLSEQLKQSGRTSSAHREREMAERRWTSQKQVGGIELASTDEWVGG